MREEDEAKRSNTGFANTVRRAFEFLEREAFVVSHAGEQLVRYSSVLMFVDVYIDPRTHEAGVEVGTLSDLEAVRPANDGPSIGRPVSNHRFTLDEIVRYLPGESGSAEPTHAAADKGSLEWLIGEHAAQLRRHGSQLLRGDAETLDVLRRARSAGALRYTREQELQQLRADAGAAWQRRDYLEVEHCLRPIGDDLTPAERTKLAYSIRHRGEVG